MVTDTQLADICAELYNHPGNMTVYFGHTTRDTCVGLKQLPTGETVIVFRGSTTIEDWFRNFQTAMLNDALLGAVSSGFYVGLPETMALLTPHIGTGPLYITGHSRGAAEALLFAAMLAIHGVFATGVVVFGSPRPGGARLKAILASVPVRSYANYLDPVTEVPVPVPALLPYEHPTQTIYFDIPPTANDPWGPLARHHLELYRMGVEKQHS
jgi:triacylglycerol lipase